MRKWLVGALLAATAGLPGLAQAQDMMERPSRQRGDQIDGGQRAERRAERQAQRQERRAERAEQPRGEVAQPRVRADAGERQGRRAEGRIGIDAAGQRVPIYPAAEQQRQARREQRREQRSVQQNEGGIVRLDRRNPSYDPARGDRPDRIERRDDRREDRADRREDRRDDRADRRFDRGDDRVNSRAWGERYGWNDGRNGGFNGNRYGYGNSNDRWNRDWRRDGRYDWNGYRSNNRNAFRLPRYYAPGGWDRGYRRFSVGVSLSSVLWGRNYWIDEPAYYRLPEAYGPYRWVRYYNDALLVDIRSGQVVDTVYDIFF